MPFISLENVTKDYGDTRAVRGVTLAIEREEWVSIMGPSGSGKTTLLNLVGALDSPSTGEVLVDTRSIGSLPERGLVEFRRETIGFIFQKAYLVAHLTAVENVMLAQYFHSMADRDEAVAALERVDMGHRLTHRPSQMSAGEQQRVCAARALINGPKILLADEPTGNLDRHNTEVLLELLRELQKKDRFTVIMVTHDPFVSRWGSRSLVMEDGRITKDVGAS